MVEIILVEIVPISALYYRFHTISILQVRKLVVQVTSTSRKTCTTSYKYKYKYKLQVTNYRPLFADSVLIGYTSANSIDICKTVECKFDCMASSHILMEYFLQCFKQISLFFTVKCSLYTNTSKICTKKQT